MAAMIKLSELFSDAEIDEMASHCWVSDEDLQYFDHKRFAKAIIFVMYNRLHNKGIKP